MSRYVHPFHVFQSFRLGWLYQHATLINLLVGDAREAQRDELRRRLRDRGLSPADANAWADWAIACTEQVLALELLGVLPR